MFDTIDSIGAVRPILRVVKVLGLWYAEDPRWRLLYAIHGRLLHLATTFAYTTMMWVDVLKAPDLEQFSYVMYMSLTELVLVAKVLNIWRHSRVLREFIACVTADAALGPRTAEERAMWSRAGRIFRLVAYSYIAMSVSLVLISFVAAPLSDDYELPFPYTPPFDWRTPRNYWIAYGYEAFAMPVTCLSNSTMDMVLCYLLLHVSLCYRLTGMRLQALRHAKAPDSEDVFQEQLERLFVLHQKVKGLSRSCETIVSSPFLAQIICSAFVLCFSAYRLAKVNLSENPSQFFVLVLAVTVMTAQIFVPCYCGNEIIVHSNGLTNAIFNADWLRSSPRQRRTIFVFMEYLKRPVRLRAGNFFEIGLPVFTRTINNAYSLLAVLFNVNK